MRSVFCNNGDGTLQNKKKFISDEYLFRSNFIKIQNHDFHYLDEGSGEPVLMIHGGLSWSFLYRNLVTALSDQGVRVLVPDLMGFGLSAHPRKFDYSIQNHIDLLIEFVEQLQLQNVTLIIHGMGAMVGLGMAIRVSSRIKRVIVLNGVAFTTPSVLFLRILKSFPIISPLFVRSSNLLLKYFYYKFRKSISKKAALSYLFPNYNYERRIALQAFFHDIPFSHRASSYGIVEDIKKNGGLLSTLECYFILADQVTFLGRRSLKKWLKLFPNATFETFHDENHFMLENIKSEVIKYIRVIVK